jgi:GNAT superfamily N-acetyltransferase
VADTEFEQALAFLHRVQERSSTRVEGWAFGTALFNDTIPQRYYSNLVRVERSLRGTATDELVAATDQALGAFEHRLIQVDDDGEGERVAADLTSFGYTPDRSVLMSLHREPDRPPDLDAVEEIPFEEVRAFEVEVYVRGLPAHEVPLAERFADFRRVVQLAANGRFFAQRVDGEIAGVCELYLVDAIAQVEHVDTLEAYRGRGIARNVVLRAVAEANAAGAGMILIEADRDDWPRDLYRRLGFDEIGSTWGFLRNPAPR